MSAISLFEEKQLRRAWNASDSPPHSLPPAQSSTTLPLRFVDLFRRQKLLRPELKRLVQLLWKISNRQCRHTCTLIAKRLAYPLC
jgi:hypothetical protein